jgi:hypothetical protein
MGKKLTLLLLAGGLFSASVSAEASVLARCGASTGHALYDGEKSWITDRISKGSFEFVADDKGNANIYFIDASGGRTDSAADGAKLSFSFIHPKLNEFGIVAIYEATGVVETYNVIRSSTGRRRLFWTSNKAKAATMAKVAAFAADCS